MILKYNMSKEAILTGYRSAKLKRWIFFFLIFIAIFNIDACDFPQIPSSELEGDLWVKSGIISYYQWNLLKPYYDSKISVPSNELSQLNTIFPEASCFIPNEKDLFNFRPWGKKEITVFFNEYPDLISLKPILTFKESKYVSNFSINTSLENEFQSAKSNLKTKFYPNEAFKFNSTISYRDSIIRWRYRSLQINTKNHTVFTLGNFSNKIASELLFGYSPKTKGHNTSPLNNWLYSNSNNWNGLKITKSLKKNSISILMHKNESETIGIIKYFIKKQSCSFSSSISAIQADNQDISYANSLNIKFEFTKFKMSLKTLINNTNPHIIPFQFDIGYSIPTRKQSIELVYLPEGYYSTHSSIYRHFTYKLYENPTANSDAFQFKHSISFKHKKKVFHGYGTSITKNNEMYYLKQTLSFKLISIISPTLKIKLEKQTTLSKASLSFNAPITINKNLNFNPNYYFYINNRNYNRNSWRLAINYKYKSVFIRPGIYYSINNNSDKKFYVFSNIKLKISNRCTGNYKLILHPFKSKANKFEVYLGQTFKI